MPTQSKQFNVLFLACCCVVILLSVLAVRAQTVSETRSLSQHARVVPVMSSVSHHIFTAGTTLSTYRQHRNTISALAWSPDGTRLASGDDDGILRVWQAAGTCRCAPAKN